MSQEQDLRISDPDDSSSEVKTEPDRMGTGSGSMSELLDSNTGQVQPLAILVSMRWTGQIVWQRLTHYWLAILSTRIPPAIPLRG